MSLVVSLETVCNPKGVLVTNTVFIQLLVLVLSSNIR